MSTLNVACSADRQGNVMEFHIVWRVVTLCVARLFNSVSSLSSSCLELYN